MADIGTTVVVALAYWTVAVLRDAVRSLALTGRRMRKLHTPGIAPQPFVAAEPDCVDLPAQRS